MTSGATPARPPGWPYLSAWLRRHEHALLFGLLVSPTETHLARVDGDVAAYEHQKLPDLVIVAVSALQAANVEPDVWKLQVSTIGPTASGPWLRRGRGRDGVVCIVLGHGADDARVRHRLAEAAGVDGYVGFAVGRTVWCNALVDLGAPALRPSNDEDQDRREVPGDDRRVRTRSVTAPGGRHHQR